MKGKVELSAPSGTFGNGCQAANVPLFLRQETLKGGKQQEVQCSLQTCKNTHCQGLLKEFVLGTATIIWFAIIPVRRRMCLKLSMFEHKMRKCGFTPEPRIKQFS